MKSIVRVGLAVLTAAALSSTAFAGARYAGDVAIRGPSVTDPESHFSGGFGEARNSTDDIQRIGCVFTDSGVISCSARDRAGAWASCVTSDPAHRQVLSGMTGSDLLAVHHNNGVCTRIWRHSASYFAPKAL